MTWIYVGIAVWLLVVAIVLRWARAAKEQDEQNERATRDYPSRRRPGP